MCGQHGGSYPSAAARWFGEGCGDAVDSADLPLANYPHHGKGLTFDAAVTVLRELCASPAFAALVLTEVNPTHDPRGELLDRYLDGVAAALSSNQRAAAEG